MRAPARTESAPTLLRCHDTTSHKSASHAACGITPQVVGRDVLPTRPLAACLYHVPDNVLRNATAPDLSLPGDRSEDFALRDIRSACPVVESGFDPARNRHGANVATLPNEINHGPVPLARLDLVQLQAHKF